MRRLSLLLVLAPLAIAACGGDGDEPARLTQDEFVSAANRVCIDADRRVYRIGDLSAESTGWRETRDAAAEGIAEMRALRPPAAKQRQFDALLVSARQLHAAIDVIYKAIVANDFPKARAGQARARAVDARIKRQAAALGLTFCAQPLTNWPA